jgi:hypothetical protein
MLPLDYALAVTLLTAAPDTPTPPDAAQQFATVLPTAQSVAISWELLDAREHKDMLRKPEDMADQLKTLRQRRLDLADAPLVDDSQRFPYRPLINELIDFNREHRKRLLNRQTVEVAFQWELKQQIQETDRLHEIWNTARDARTGYLYVWVRRAALKKLRELIGPQAYYSGCLPPHVPVWGYSQLD